LPMDKLPPERHGRLILLGRSIWQGGMPLPVYVWGSCDEFSNVDF